MSNQRTPLNTRRIRRSEDNPSRGLFIEDNEIKEKKNFFSLIINKFLRRDKEEDLKTAGRRREYKEFSIKQGLSRNNYKPVHIFEQDEKGDNERRRRRSSKSTKTLIFFGASLLIFVGAVIGSIFIFSDNNATAGNLSDSTEIKNRVTLYIDDMPTEIYTNAVTVGEMLEENDIELSETQKASHSEDEAIENDMEIFISNPMTVSVLQNGIVNSVTMYGGRVSDVFEEMEIEIDENDIIEPDVDTLVTDQMQIEFVDVEIKNITVVEDVPFGIEEGETSTVESGYYHLEQDGENGAVQVTYEVKLVDGTEISREEIKRDVIQEPKNKIVLWGTATPSSKKSSSSSSDDDSDSSSDSSSSGTTVKNPDDQATNPSVPASPSDYIETMSGHVTAYTHTGSKTATGTWPRSTRTLDNPGTCAVVPSTIPYGSLLYVTGYGYCVAEDTGAFRTDPDRWNQIDLFMNTRSECITWGRRDGVKVYILRKGY